MPEERKVTIGPRTTPPVTPWDVVWRALLGSGAVGMSPLSSSLAGVGPFGWTPQWSALGMGAGQPQPGVGEEEPIEPWEMAGFKSQAEYLKARPWRKENMKRAEYENWVQSQAQQTKAEKLRKGKPPAISPWQASILQMAGMPEIEGLENLTPEQQQWFMGIVPSIAERQRELGRTELEKWQTGQQLAAQERQNQLVLQQKMEQAASDEAIAQQKQQRQQWLLEQYRSVGAPISQEVAAAQQQAAVGAMGAGYMGAGSGGGGSWFPAARAMAEARQELEQRSWGFEKMREQIMSSTAPREWVSKEKARLAINPYEAAKTQMQGNWGAAIPQVPVNPEPKYSGIPEVPQNVQPFMGREKTFGGALETPSGQAWTAAPWSTREALIGYSEALGQPRADLLGAMEAMRPNAPERGTSWAPARRR